MNMLRNFFMKNMSVHTNTSTYIISTLNVSTYHYGAYLYIYVDTGTINLSQFNTYATYASIIFTLDTPVAFLMKYEPTSPAMSSLTLPKIEAALDNNGATDSVEVGSDSAQIVISITAASLTKNSQILQTPQVLTGIFWTELSPSPVNLIFCGGVFSVASTWIKSPQFVGMSITPRERTSIESEKVETQNSTSDVVIWCCFAWFLDNQDLALRNTIFAWLPWSTTQDQDLLRFEIFLGQKCWKYELYCHEWVHL